MKLFANKMCRTGNEMQQNAWDNIREHVKNSKNSEGVNSYKQGQVLFKLLNAATTLKHDSLMKLSYVTKYDYLGLRYNTRLFSRILESRSFSEKCMLADAFLVLVENKKEFEAKQNTTRKLFQRVLETKMLQKQWAFFKWNDVRRYFDQADLYMKWKIDSMNSKIVKNESLTKLKYLLQCKSTVKEQNVYKRCGKLNDVMIISQNYCNYNKRNYFNMLENNARVNPWLCIFLRKCTLLSPIEEQIAMWRLRDEPMNEYKRPTTNVAAKAIKNAEGKNQNRAANKLEK